MFLNLILIELCLNVSFFYEVYFFYMTIIMSYKILVLSPFRQSVSF